MDTIKGQERYLKNILSGSGTLPKKSRQRNYKSYYFQTLYKKYKQNVNMYNKLFNENHKKLKEEDFKKIINYGE